MKVKVNRDACIGCGACCAVAGDLFEIDEEGLSLAKSEVVPEGMEDAAQDAVDSCPTGAIEKTEE